MPNILSPSRDTIILGKNSKYTEEENIALSKQPNTKSPEQLAEENIPFVHHLIEKEFARYYRVVGIPKETLISAGMHGLVIAANKSKYGTFLRYASFWIRYYIYNEIRNYFFIKRQSSYCLKLNKIRKFQAKYINKYEEEPSMEWLSEQTGFDVDTIIDVLKFDEQNSTSTVSLEAMQEDKENKTKIDAIMESECTSLDISSMEYRDLAYLICHVLWDDERDAVLLKYFGHLTNRQIKERLGSSKSPLSIGHMIDKGVQKIQEHVQKEKRFHELTGLETTEAWVNTELNERNKDIDFDKLLTKVFDGLTIDSLQLS